MGRSGFDFDFENHFDTDFVLAGKSSGTRGSEPVEPVVLTELLYN